MRRASIVLPVLLVLVGTLALLNNLRPDLVNFRNLLMLWPYALIAWGLLRLGEITYWAGQGRPLPASGLSGGEWTLIVLVTVVTSGIVTVQDKVRNRDFNLVRIGGFEMFGEPREFAISGEVDDPKVTVVVVENRRGRIKVQGSEGSKVKVTGEKIVRALETKASDEANEKCPLEMTVEGTRLVVRTNLERIPENTRAEANLEIAVPKGVNVELRGGGRSGGFEVADVSGGVEIEGERGDVRATNVGSLRMKMRGFDQVKVVGVAGNVEIEGKGDGLDMADVKGGVVVNADFSDTLTFRNIAKGLQFKSSRTELRLEKIEGKVIFEWDELDLAGIAGPVYVKSRSKDIRMSDYAGPVEVDLDRGSVELVPRLPLGKTRVEATSGDVNLRMPEKAVFELKAKVERGSVSNNFGSELRENCDRDDCELNGVVGKGGPLMEVRTRRGSVTVTKGTFFEVRPAEPPAVQGPPPVKGPPPVPGPPPLPGPPRLQLPPSISSALR
jgi:DUF4097 and DUF4098 domain-containing protein YvlB